MANWNTSYVTNMAYTFENNVYFNDDIGGWDVSNVDAFSGMFAGATNFNQDLSRWDVRGATHPGSLTNMFDGATAFQSGQFANKTRDCWAHRNPMIYNWLDSDYVVDDDDFQIYYDDDAGIGFAPPAQNLTAAQFEQQCMPLLETPPDDDDSSSPSEVVMIVVAICIVLFVGVFAYICVYKRFKRKSQFYRLQSADL